MSTDKPDTPDADAAIAAAVAASGKPAEEGEHPTDQEYVNPFLEEFKFDELRDIAGREIKPSNQKYPNAVVTPMAPAKKDGPARYIVRWGLTERKSKKSKKVKKVYEHEEVFTVGQCLDDDLPGFLREELAETAERCRPYIETSMALSKEIPMAAQSADEIRMAIVKTADKEVIAANPEHFITLMNLRQAEVARMEATWRQAKMQYCRQFMDCAWHIFLSNAQMWLGCMLPIGIVTHPATKKDGSTDVTINLEVMPLPLTQDHQETQDFTCGADLRWQDTETYLAICPEMQTESFYRQAARKSVGPSLDKKAPLSLGDSVPTPAGMKKTESGLVVPQ